MIGLLVLHIAALVFWIAALLYLPVLMIGRQNRVVELQESPHPHDSVARFVFTQVASPAAIVAIMAGTAVFLLNQTTSPWLIAKLTLVVLLAIGHCLMGLLVIRLERKQDLSVQPWSGLLLAYFSAMATAITWLVLAKPSWDWPL